MNASRLVVLLLLAMVLGSCGGSSETPRPTPYAGIWRGTLTEGGRTYTLLIDQRQTGARTKGYARLIDGQTTRGGILRGTVSASGYTATIDFGGDTGAVSLVASGGAASVQVTATGGGDVLRDAQGVMTHAGPSGSPAGTWIVTWTDNFGNTDSFDIVIALVDGGYEVLAEPISMPGLSGLRFIDLSVIGMDVAFKAVISVAESNSVINWSIPALGSDGTFEGILLPSGDPMDVSGTCTTRRAP